MSSVRELKAKLDERGVDYTGCTEKSELTALLSRSAALTLDVSDAPGAAASSSSTQIATAPFTQIAPMVADVTLKQDAQKVGAARATGVAGSRDTRGSAARQRLAKKLGVEAAEVDNSIHEMCIKHNATNALAVASGQAIDLPYLEGLVNTLRGAQTKIMQGKKTAFRSEREQNNWLKERRREVEARHKECVEDLFIKVKSCTSVVRKPDPAWQILVGKHGANQYWGFKSKAKVQEGQAAENYGMVIALYDDASHATPMSVMQRTNYLENYLLYCGLEALANVQLADELLLRLQRQETELRVPFADAASMELREALVDAEDTWHELVEAHGRNPPPAETPRGPLPVASLASVELCKAMVQASDATQKVTKAVGAALANLKNREQGNKLKGAA